MNIKKFTYSLLIALLFISCNSNDDDIFDVVNGINTPTNVAAIFRITQDNTGLVTITPTAEGANSFQVFYGDGSSDSATVIPGESITRMYSEGDYSVRIIAIALNGATAEATKQLVVSFRAPENLVVNIEIDSANNFQVNVSATADFATGFDVFFGDVENEVPTPLMLNETISHIYPEVGDYVIRVVALSGGAATLEYTETITILNPLLLPIDFEDPTLAYNFTDFGGATSSVVANPVSSGSNTSSTVGQTIKAAGAEVFAGSFLQVDAPIDFSSLQNLSVDVYSPVSGIVVKLKIENATNPDIAAEVDVVNTLANEWETLTFDFSNFDLTMDYQKIIIFFDFGNTGDGTTYYFDNIKRAQSTADSFELFENFEGEAPIFTNFGDIAPTEVVSNPSATGVNTTANVAQFNKSTGSQTFGGTFFELTDQVIEFAGLKKIRIRAYSPSIGKVVKLKLENSDASITHEVDMLTTVANAWEIITFDFVDAPAAQYNRVVTFFDFGNVGDGSIYYFDEMEVGEGSLVSTIPPLPVQDFEGAAPVFTAFGDMEQPTITTNPDTSGINTSAMTASQVKNTGSATFAGCFFEVATPLDFQNYSKLSLLVNSPRSGITVKVKLENQDASVTTEVDVVNNVAGSWEELEFNFSDAPQADYVRIVIFFDFGFAGDGSTYLFDEIKLKN